MSKKRRLKPYDAVAFTNEMGSVINPGDDILIVTICTRSPSVSKGRYLGKRAGSTWNGKTHYNVVVEVDEVHKKLLHNETKEAWDYGYEPPGMKRPKYPERAAILSSFYWNQKKSPEYEAAEKKYAEDVHEYRKQDQAYRDAVNSHRDTNYSWVEFPYVRAATLQRNLIFPINLKAVDLVGQRIS